MLRGLIGGVMKGVGEGYTQYAKGELENQQKLDYQERYLQMLEEKDKRIAEFAQDLRIKGISKEALARVDADIAVIDRSISAGLPAKKADLNTAEYEAGRPLAITKSADAGRDAARTTVEKVNAQGYTDAVSKESVAKSAGDIEEIRERNRDTGTGSGKGDTSIDLERRFKAANRNLAQALGVADNKVNEELGSLKRKVERGDPNAVKRWESIKGDVEDWQSANQALRNFTRNGKGSSANVANPSSSRFEVGETKVIQSGPHKGKTAVWDGTGWALQ